MPLFDPNVFHPQVFKVGQYPLGAPTTWITRNAGFEGNTKDHRGRDWNRQWILYRGGRFEGEVALDDEHPHYGQNCIRFEEAGQMAMVADDWMPYWSANFPFVGGSIHPSHKTEFYFLNFSSLLSKIPKPPFKVSFTLNFSHTGWTEGAEAPYDGLADPLKFTFCDDDTWNNIPAEEKAYTHRICMLPDEGNVGKWHDCEYDLLTVFEGIYGYRARGLGGCGQYEGYSRYQHLQGAYEWHDRNYDFEFLTAPTFYVQVEDEGLGGAKLLLDDIQIRHYDWNPYPTEIYWSCPGILSKPGYITTIIETTQGKILAGGFAFELGAYHPTIWKSGDKGVTWSEHLPMPTNPAYPMVTDVMEDSNGDLWCTVGSFVDFMGVYGGILKSTDEGETWVLKSPGADKGFYSIMEANDGTLFAVEGENMVAFSPFIVHRSIDGGATWNVVFTWSFSATGGANVLQDANGDYFIAVSRFAGLNHLDIYKSTDGINWILFSSIPEAIQQWKGILYQTSDGTYWTSAYPYPKLYKSPDAVNWVEEPLGNLGTATDLMAMLELSGGEYLVTTNWGEVWKYENDSWESVGIAEASQVWDVCEGPLGVWAGITNNDPYNMRNVWKWVGYGAVPEADTNLCGPSPVGEEFHEEEGESNLLCIFEVRHSTSQELLSEFSVRRSSFQELLAEFISRPASSVDLLGEFIVRQAVDVDLLGEFIVLHKDSEELFCKFTIRCSCVPRPSTPTRGPSPHYCPDLKCVFQARHSALLELPAYFIVRHQAYAGLRADFDVRCVYPLWTNRGWLNGIIELKANPNLSDSFLEEIIAGVMNDIKTWLIAEEIDQYSSWTNIDLTPRAIRRATTYGTVASLYARKVFGPQDKVVRVAPMDFKTFSSSEAAMEYWEGMMNRVLELYLSGSGLLRIWIDTIDEDPVFSMDDIPLYTWNPDNV